MQMCTCKCERSEVKFEAIHIFLNSTHHSSAANNIAGPVRCLHNNYIVEREIMIIRDIDDLYHIGGGADDHYQIYT